MDGAAKRGEGFWPKLDQARGSFIHFRPSRVEHDEQSSPARQRRQHTTIGTSSHRLSATAASLIWRLMSSAHTWIPSSIAIPYITATFALLVSIVVLMSFLWRRRIDFSGKHCYIGGGSEGLGLALACLLVERGAHVSIVSRSKVKLEAALARIETHRQSPSQQIASYACDLTLADDAAATLNLACETFGEAPDFVFACAGGTFPGFFADLDAERHWQGMQWNFKTALCTIHEATRRMRQEGKPGKIVFTASVLAMMGFAGYSAYTPSKYAIRGLAETLRNELQMYGISVHLFLPATILSPGFVEEQKVKPAMTRRIEGPDVGLTPEVVAAHMIRGLDRDNFYITYEPVGHMLRNSRGITPRNNVLIDTLWGIAGTIAFPIWRRISPDSEVRAEAKKILSARKMQEGSS
ncbi:BZ3500_MvSof-1268-A1-R1_Chr1-1g00850 [Microbotryum saponariae]|uniref:3-dehydrosphinganine reductase n=1 Tax=Microbotryum saponariae TaxID=289078 RepID=A0A2X0KN67_9BASI|nr:BZ3500_MvSof-1268-A1-R1_Chr1-1g00850 [Microbotryum saponariae]SCZ92776.1 BZ3501_MvSof-1269-A2-R1_Chr1-1g00447 [Microbotryum saponariae]